MLEQIPLLSTNKVVEFFDIGTPLFPSVFRSFASALTVAGDKTCFQVDMEPYKRKVPYLYLQAFIRHLHFHPCALLSLSPSVCIRLLLTIVQLIFGCATQGEKTEWMSAIRSAISAIGKRQVTPKEGLNC